MPHITVLDPPGNGHIIVIGDVHGDDINKRLTTMRSIDILIIAGDLTDRGKNNLEIIELILQCNADPTKPTIYVVRGNHEEMVIDSIRAMNKILINLMKKNDRVDEAELLEMFRKNDHLSNHFLPDNGGAWLRDLYLDEFFNTKMIRVTHANKMEYKPASKLLQIKTFFSNLPYIIRVRGNVRNLAFNVVHADMPVDDETLKRLIKTNGHLTPQQIRHATWKRQNDFGFGMARNVLTSAYIAGHNITISDNKCVMPELNYMNTDIGSFFTHVTCSINMTTGSVEILGTIPEQFQARINEIKLQLGEYLQRYQLIKKFYFDPFMKATDIHEVLTHIEKANQNEYDSIVKYLLNNDGFTRFGIETQEDLTLALNTKVEVNVNSPTQSKKRPPLFIENSKIKSNVAARPIKSIKKSSMR